jgi:hypothetical protein
MMFLLLILAGLLGAGLGDIFLNREKTAAFVAVAAGVITAYLMNELTIWGVIAGLIGWLMFFIVKQIMFRKK